jgi:peptidoglycan/xylan/chitin deacetylase (PgdA/CDA1 family)
MQLVAGLTLSALHATAAVAGFGWLVPFSPQPPADSAPVESPAPPSLSPPLVPAPPPAEELPPPKRSQGLRPIRLIATREPAVAITFDACATRSQAYGFDRKVFELLKREQIPATIFVSGRWVEGHPDAMQELAADPLIEFGDHSYDHPHMANLPVARVIEEIDQTEAALARYGKHSVAFRPPFGEWSSRLIYVVQDLRLPTVTWDVVSGDPSAHTTVDGMVRNVVPKARAGSIIIFHINGRGLKTAEALPSIVRQLRERGFRFVPLSELMAGGTAPVPIPVAPLPAAPGPAATPIPAASNTPSSTLPDTGPQ